MKPEKRAPGRAADRGDERQNVVLGKMCFMREINGFFFLSSPSPYWFHSSGTCIRAAVEQQLYKITITTSRSVQLSCLNTLTSVDAKRQAYVLSGAHEEYEWEAAPWQEISYWSTWENSTARRSATVRFFGAVRWGTMDWKRVKSV